MFGGVSHVFNVPGSNFTAADLTIGWVANHAVQIHHTADNPVIHNVRFVDTGERHYAACIVVPVPIRKFRNYSTSRLHSNKASNR